MEQAILELHFPDMDLPGKGFRCPVCHRESLLMDEVKRLEEVADRLGAYGVQDVGTRSLLRVGGSLAVTIDPELARSVLGTTRPGDKVRVGRQGNRIVIQAGPKRGAVPARTKKA